MERTGNFLPPYVSTRPLVLVLTGLLLTTAALSSVSAGFEISEIRLLSRVLDDQAVSWQDRWAHGFTRNALFAARAAAIGAAAAVFVGWLYRSRINARAFGSRRFRFGRNWAIGSFLVPGLNLVRPLQILTEVWKASDPRGTRSPLDWKTMPVPGFVAAWWWMLLGCGVVAVLGTALTTTTGVTVAQLRVARGVMALADLAIAVNAVLGYFVVAGIYENQEEKWAVLGGRGIFVPSAAASTPDVRHTPGATGAPAHREPATAS